MEAHAVPELIGNRAIIAYDECDACNKLFANSLEDHLGKMLNGALNVSRVSGKKGVPTLATKHRHSRIDVSGDHMALRSVQTDPMIAWDPATKTVTVTAPTQPLIPLAVFKTLTKMALAIMPQVDLQHFQQAIDWIREPDHEKNSADFAFVARCYAYFLPGPMPPDLGWVRLLRRRAPDADLPYMLFVSLFRNTAIQIMVPCCPLDNHWVGTPITLPPYPVFYGFGYHWGESTRQVCDLSSPTKKSISFKAEIKAEHAWQTAPP